MQATAEPLVPGTGEKVAKVGDDFEDPKWTYVANAPKSSNEQDGRTRLPGGMSKNGQWFEAALRGQPDVVQRVPTPAGGLPGSQGAMLMRTLNAGVPGVASNKTQQDDLIASVGSRVGGYVPISWSPSVVVRVFLPPFDEWEDRSGNSFGFRAALQARNPRKRGAMETYWPGMFFHFYSQTDRRTKADYAMLLARADGRGQDFFGPKITQTGWWTLGMSFTRDGQVHYYAKPGVEDLTAQDHIASHTPYGFRAERFDTFFFDILSQDNGHSWSTSWIVDDPELYFVRR